MRFVPVTLEAATAAQYIGYAEYVGSRMLFAQGTAPLGWTKDTTYNDYGLRVTSGTIATGGSLNFSSVMSSLTLAGTATLTGTAVGATTLSSSNLPYHYHSGPWVGATYAGAAVSPNKAYFWGNYTSGAAYASPSAQWLGGSHTHTISPGTAPAGVPLSMAVRYQDVIIASKN